MTLISDIKIQESLADPAIVQKICHGLKQMRLNKNMSQSELASISGVNRVTISRMESGRAATLLTVVQILRALEKLDILNTFCEEAEVSPLELVKLKRKQRHRASVKRVRPNPSQTDDVSEW